MEADWNRRTITFMLILVWTSTGLYSEIGGPTLLDLRMRFDANSESIARAVSAQGAGAFVGALLGGVLVELLSTWKILIVSGSQVLAIAAIISMPFVGTVSMLWFMFFVLGISGGAVNVCGQRIIIEQWKEEAPSPMHATHMGFGIGALTAPLIANPFLAVLKFPNDNSINSTSSTNSTMVVVKESRVHLAYVTIGIVSAALTLPVLVYSMLMCCVKRYRDSFQKQIDDHIKDHFETKIHRRSIRGLIKMLNPATYANGSLAFGSFVFVMVIFYFVNLVGGEQLFGNFIRTYSVDQMHFSRDDASYLDTIYWGSYTVGRFIGSILSHYIHIKKLIVIDAVLYLLSVVLLNIFSAKFNSNAVLWAFTAIVGFLVAPLFPAGVSFTNTYVEVGVVVLTLIVFSSGCSHLLYIWIAGYLYQHYGPQTILYTVLTASILVFITVLVFVGATHRRKERFDPDRHQYTGRDGFNAGDLLYTPLVHASDTEDETVN